ncbi:phosphate uptake regulator PhoU [Prolixibacteraceae bacterium JC049]|nr:phosphate uptake regulator PhoU [Prolixibacteraceae bacterium JC049]
MLKKENAIQNILESFKEYSDIIMQQLDLLETIIQTGDTEIDKQLIAQMEKNENKLDKFEVKISDKIINTIVLHHPMASELRKIIACYRMVINMERIGDLIMNIVKFIQKIEDKKLYAELSDVIFNMLVSSENMVQKSLLSYLNEDREYAIWTIKNDDVVDEMNKKLMKKSINKSGFSDEARTTLMNLINVKSIVYNIERIADQATHIAEASIYSLEGKDIRHKDIEQ